MQYQPKTVSHAVPVLLIDKGAGLLYICVRPNSPGIHPKVVQELLGRTQISIMMDVYSHLLPGMQKEAMSKLDETSKKKQGDEKKESS